MGWLSDIFSDGGEETTTKNLDPRIARYIYGADGNGGLLGDAQSIYSQQMQQGGLNDMQRQGLNMQAQYLQSPQYQNSYQSMLNRGMEMMNAPRAGNPFTRSQQGGQAPSMPSVGFQYTPSQAQVPIYRPEVRQPATQTGGTPTQGQIPDGNNRSGGGNFSGGGGLLGGQGNSEAVTSAALAAMAAGENPLLRAFFPTIALASTLGGRAFADQQIGARTSAFTALNDAAPFAGAGLGTISDADGGISTFSSPDSIAAADAATFGQTDSPAQSSFGGSGSGGGNRGYGNMGNGGYGGATGGYGGSYGSGSVGGW